MAQLEAMGILARSGSNERNRLFRYKEYIDILTEGDDEKEDDENQAPDYTASAEE